ncbi:hypothetical protein [Devosia sp.]|uniref:hypothetical protein n=1 Tax=Devosia sp. TaxID=1871048 RepID=UPI003A93A742
MEAHDRLSFLSEEIGTSIHSKIIDHVVNVPVSSQKLLISEIIFYSDTLCEIIKSKSIERNNKSINSILIHISKNYKFRTAKKKHKVIVNLIKNLIDKKIIESSIEVEQSLNETKYKELRLEHENLILESKRSDYGIFLKKIDIRLSGDISKILKEYITKKQNSLDVESRHTILNFIVKIQSQNKNWMIDANAISIKLIEENIEILDTQNKSIRNANKSKYNSIRKFLESLRNNCYIPIETHLPKFKNTKEETKIKNRDFNDLTTERIKTIKKEINKKARVALDTIITESSRVERLIKTIDEHIEILKGILNNFEDELIKLDAIYISICEKNTYNTARELTTSINKLILLIYGEFDQRVKKPIRNLDEYNSAKTKKIPKKINKKIKITRTLDSDLTDSLRNLPSDIRNRINEHINSYKTTKVIKRQTTIFINHLLDKNKEWYKDPDLIYQEMEIYKSKLIKDGCKSTAYKNIYELINLFKVLRRHELIPKNTHLSNNIKRDKPLENKEIENPLIISKNIYQNRKERITDTNIFLDRIKKELHKNLEKLKSEAQSIIFDHYKKFKSTDKIVSDNLKNIPSKLRNIESSQVKIHYDKNKNPFLENENLNTNNRIAYFHIHFNKLIRAQRPFILNQLRFDYDILEHFTITPLLASAMQLIIIEETGVNPHSLYFSEVVKNHSNLNYITINKEGEISIQLTKPRARKVRKIVLKSDKKSLSEINKSEIDASACIRMALEIGKRSRDSLGSNHLWICSRNNGASCLPNTSTFQCNFKKISNRVFEESSSTYATLKKVRSSKGVYIYLESQGDTLQVCNYFGNNVDTALKHYIPEYLSELMYRHKIRNFQDIFLYTSIEKLNQPEDILKIKKTEFKERLEESFKNIDMGGQLFNKLKVKNQNTINTSPLYFCVSLSNIHLALKYLKNGNDDELSKKCKSVIKKISDGPVYMKKLLREASMLEM